MSFLDDYETNDVAGAARFEHARENDGSADRDDLARRSAVAAANVPVSAHDFAIVSASTPAALAF